MAIDGIVRQLSNGLVIECSCTAKCMQENQM